MLTTFLIFIRDAIIWLANALMAPLEPIYDLVDGELARRDVHWSL